MKCIDFYNNCAWKILEQKDFKFETLLSSTSIFLNATLSCFYFWTGKWLTLVFLSSFEPVWSVLNIEVGAYWNEVTVKKKRCYTVKVKDEHSQTDSARSIDGLCLKLKKSLKNLMQDFSLNWLILGKKIIY